MNARFKVFTMKREENGLNLFVCHQIALILKNI